MHLENACKVLEFDFLKGVGSLENVKVIEYIHYFLYFL